MNILNMQIPGYQILSKVGQGGNGVVYKARQSSTDRIVAIKYLDQDVDINRIRNEVRLHASISHPSIAALLDLIEVEGRMLLVMEYVDGPTLKDFLQRKGNPLSSSSKNKLFARIIEPVNYLHTKQIIHRDLKPENIKILPDGQIKLLDFGISVGISTPKLTREGFMVGSLRYAAPERLKSKHHIQSDVWSLGAIYYEIQTLRPLIDGVKPEEAIRQITSESYIDSQLSALEKDAQVICRRCLRPDPSKRYPSAAAVVDALNGSSKPKPMLSPKASKWLLLGVAVLTIAVLGWLIIPKNQTEHVTENTAQVQFDFIPDHATLELDNNDSYTHGQKVQGIMGSRVRGTLQATGYYTKEIELTFPTHSQHETVQYILRKK